jgi:hypothetical protein
MLTKGSKLFFIFFSLAILSSFVVTFYNKGIQRQFEIFTDEEAFTEALAEYFAE